MSTPKISIIKDRKVNIRPDTAREAYYLALVAHNGKSAESLLKAWDTKAPKLPKSGKIEKASGWLAFFVKEGYCEIKE